MPPRLNRCIPKRRWNKFAINYRLRTTSLGSGCHKKKRMKNNYNFSIHFLKQNNFRPKIGPLGRLRTPGWALDALTYTHHLSTPRLRLLIHMRYIRYILYYYTFCLGLGPLGCRTRARILCTKHLFSFQIFYDLIRSLWASPTTGTSFYCYSCCSDIERAVHNMLIRCCI